MFDDPNLVSSAGLVPVMALSEAAGLRRVADAHLSVPTDKGANAGLKVASLVAGMVAGADSIDDMAILRHGGMSRAFDSAYAPSTLGSFLRAFTFGHVRQLDAVASRLLSGLAERTPVVSGIDGLALVDIDDTMIEVHGYAKQGAGFGYSGVRGLNALAATLTTKTTAPVIVATRLRKGSAGSPRGAGRLATDALKTVQRLRGNDATGTMLLRADSAYYGRPTVLAAVKAGAMVSITVRQDATIRHAIEQMDTVDADRTHRGHAIIEQVFADLKASALAHLPSGSFAANSAWLVLTTIAFNLTRALGTIAGGHHAKATTATIRRRLVAIPARVATSARRLTLHLPTAWPWQDAWQRTFDTTFGPPAATTT